MKTNFITKKDFQKVIKNKVNKKQVNKKQNQSYITGIKVLIKINKNK
jgi:hypothetical protein